MTNRKNVQNSRPGSNVAKTYIDHARDNNWHCTFFASRCAQIADFRRLDLQEHFVKILNLAAALALAPLIAGCSATNSVMSRIVSVEVSEEIIASRTEMAIGEDAENFVMSDISKEGTRTDWKVKMNSGATYRCYLEAAQDFGAKSISDAICSGAGAKSDKGTCDALSKAAGRC
jgi:hypothetical protein